MGAVWDLATWAIPGVPTSSEMSGGGGKSSAPSEPTPIPKPPTPEASVEKAQKMAQKKRSEISRSIYTSPLGIGGEASVSRKVLLGQ